MLTEWKEDWGKKSKMALLSVQHHVTIAFLAVLFVVFTPYHFVQNSDEKHITVNPCYLVSINSYVRTEILTLS